MKEFLKKYMTEEQLQAFEEAYKAANPESKGLPVYISKSRLDEVLGKQHAAEAEVSSLKTQIETMTKENKTATDDAITKAIEEATAKVKTEYEAKLIAQKTDFDTTEAIYKAHGRNVKAIKALIDETKPIAEEIERLQKDEPYLFVKPNDDIPGGTGKKGDDAETKNEKELAAMRRAVGLK